MDSGAVVNHRHVHRKAIVATLTFAGLRIGELTALRWRDVDLAAGWLTVGESKTGAGRRRVKIRAALLGELKIVRADADPVDPDGYVFGTSQGNRQSSESIGNRMLTPAVKRASERLVAAGYSSLPERVTPHSLRRTFAGVLFGLWEDPGVVQDELGHADPGLALRV